MQMKNRGKILTWCAPKVYGTFAKSSLLDWFLFGDLPNTIDCISHVYLKLSGNCDGWEFRLRYSCCTYSFSSRWQIANVWYSNLSRFLLTADCAFSHSIPSLNI